MSLFITIPAYVKEIRGNPNVPPVVHVTKETRKVSINCNRIVQVDHMGDDGCCIHLDRGEDRCERIYTPLGADAVFYEMDVSREGYVP